MCWTIWYRALDVPGSKDEIVEVGGASIETYRSMMLTYAQIRGLKRWLLRVPVLTPRLSSYWLNLVTPFPAAITRPLIEGLKTEVVCTSGWAARPCFLESSRCGYAGSGGSCGFGDWSGQICRRDDRPQCVAHSTQAPGNHLRCPANRWMQCACGPGVRAFCRAWAERLAGCTRNLLWQIRGWLDLARRRGHVERPTVKEQIAGWRLRGFLARRRSGPREKKFLLHAEMKLPGRAWLQFMLIPDSRERTLLRCFAWFEPSWTCRRALLVGALSHPRVDFPWHGASYCSQV